MTRFALITVSALLATAGLAQQCGGPCGPMGGCVMGCSCNGAVCLSNKPAPPPSGRCGGPCNSEGGCVEGCSCNGAVCLNNPAASGVQVTTCYTKEWCEDGGNGRGTGCEPPQSYPLGKCTGVNGTTIDKFKCSGTQQGGGTVDIENCNTGVTRRVPNSECFQTRSGAWVAYTCQ